ncbi:MAG: hypothetical protein ACRDFX_00285 [Chloroflexota bacterium]
MSEEELLEPAPQGDPEGQPATEEDAPEGASALLGQIEALEASAFAHIISYKSVWSRLHDLQRSVAEGADAADKPAMQGRL